MNPPLVSVMMPVYNVGRYVGKAVESILNQTFEDFEFLIVNDGSTDGSLEILREYAARDRRIRLSSRGNIGLAGSRDELLKAAQGELAACMDADDISSPDRLEKQVAYLREHPECSLVGSRVTIIDPDGEPLQVMGEHLEHEAIDRSLMNAEGQSIYNPSVMYRRHLALQVGGYRQEYDYMEDLDLFLRMAEVGRLANLPQPLLQYREHLGKVGHARPPAIGRAARHAARGLPSPRPRRPRVARRLRTGASACRRPVQDLGLVGPRLGVHRHGEEACLVEFDPCSAVGGLVETPLLRHPPPLTSSDKAPWHRSAVGAVWFRPSRARA